MKLTPSDRMPGIVIVTAVIAAVALIWHPWQKANSWGSLPFADGSFFQSVQPDCPECLNAIPACKYLTSSWTYDGTSKRMLACPSTGEEFGFRQATQSEVYEYLYDHEIYDHQMPGCDGGRQWGRIVQCDGKILESSCGLQLIMNSYPPVIENNVYCTRFCKAVFVDKSGNFYTQRLSTDGRYGPIKSKVRRNAFQSGCGRKAPN